MSLLRSARTGGHRPIVDSERAMQGADSELIVPGVVPFRRSATIEVLPGTWLAPPGRAHKYKITERVAAGGEGVIFRAEMIVGPGASGIVVAVKQYLPPDNGSESWPHDGTWMSLARQAAFLAGLPKNDHLVWIREVFLGSAESLDESPKRAPEIPFVVMDWLNGSPPDPQVSRTNGALRRRVGYIEHLAEAVGILHSDSQRNPLSHSDIKPDNCLVTADRGLVLVDLGGLHLAAGEDSGQGLHTEPFAAPEVLADPFRARGLASDMYSLAATAFWFMTGAGPPNPDHPEYLAEAAVALRSCRPLRRPLTRRLRRSVVRHLLTGLAPDPAQRDTLDPVRWARRLRVLTRRPMIRRRTALGVTALGIVLSVLQYAGVLPFDTPSPVDTARHVVHWNLLPPDPPEKREVTYTAELARNEPPWIAKSDGTTAVRRTAEGVALTMKQNRAPAVFSAPRPERGGHGVVEASGYIASGQGAWGLWCRGTSSTARKRYRFLLTHAGAVGIFSYDGTGAGAPREEGSGWWYLDGIDLAAPVTMTAHCSDAPSGQQVALRLSINGRTVLGYSPDVDAVLSPGYAGIEEFSFADVDGPKLTAVLTSFTTAAAIT